MPRHANSKEEGSPIRKLGVGIPYDTQTLSGGFFSGIDNWGSSSGSVVGFASKVSSSEGRGGGWFLVSNTLKEGAMPRKMF